MKISLQRFCLSAALGLMLATPAFADDDDWPMFGHDPFGARYNTGEKRLGPSNAAKLTVLWKFSTPAIVAGTPAVVGDAVFDGDTAGNVYALKAKDGKLLWKATIQGASFTGSPTVLRGRVVIGSRSNGVIYGLDRDTGSVTWQAKPNSFGRPAIWGSGTQVGKFVAIGV